MSLTSESLAFPPKGSGIESDSELAYRCGGSAGLVNICDAPASRFTRWMVIRQAPEVQDKREDDAWLPLSCQGKRAAAW